MDYFKYICHVSNQVKHAFILWPSNLIFRYLPKRKENILCPHKDLYKNVQSSRIHIRPKLERTQMSINGKMNKQIVVNLYSGIILSNKIEQITKTLYQGQQSGWSSESLC